jgi:hypothetical protein
MIRRSLGQDGLHPVLRILDVLFDERDREDLLLLVGAFPGRRSHTAVKEGRVLFKDGRFEAGLFVLAADVEVLFEVVDGGGA